uniref:DNA 3'-5' helicase n=1 Tax=Octactis speculum TaxID=3111310 RepID=A0A6U4A5F5_9STRA
MRRARLLGLTATLCSNQVDGVRKMVGFDKNTVVLKRSTDRANLSYSVLDLGYFEGTNDAVMVKSVELLMPHVFLSAKTMIFVATRSDCDFLAKHLSASCIPSWPYHGKLEKATRRENWNAWSDAQGYAVLVSTSLGGTGRNQPMVDLVIQLTVRPNIYSMVQEFGRAGRKGQGSRCIVVAHPIYLQHVVSFVDFQDPIEYRMFIDVIEFIFTRAGCRRQKIQSLLGDELFCAGSCPSSDDVAKGKCDRCDVTKVLGTNLYSLLDVTNPAIALLKEIEHYSDGDGAHFVQIFSHGDWRSRLVPSVASACFMYVLINYLRFSKVTYKTDTGCFSTLMLNVDAIRSAHVISLRETIWVECDSSLGTSIYIT